MSGNVPPGYRLYAAVVARLDWVRECGGGLTFHCPLPARHRNGDRNPSGRCWVANDGSLMLRCLGCGADAHDLLAELGLPITECFPDKGKRGRTVSDQHPEAKAVEEYQYHDRAGVCLAVKTRWEPGFNGRPKDFTWWRPVPADVLPAVRRAYDLPRDCVPRVYGPGCLRSGEYSVHRAGDRLTFRATTDGDNQSHHLPACCLGLYRLPGLLRANPAHPVLVVEGERKADTLTALGFVATSGYAGKGKWETGVGVGLRRPAGGRGPRPRPRRRGHRVRPQGGRVVGLLRGRVGPRGRVADPGTETRRGGRGHSRLAQG